ncbi:MAG: methionyl-tRNA formyltransferase [Bacteroidales bacterium]|nr:methionyl-tRNA formyltransferase [Lentimicrobiaceae bacterium]MDD5693875.1 methionyl-tRNA formyltransferase [Bacteroidales bacterium]
MSLRIVYMGSPDFAIGPLSLLVENGYTIPAVVTVPDKPAGRGQKLSSSPVKRYALSKKIPVLQPENLQDESFIGQLRDLQPDLQIVVAFRILPEIIWKLPPRGTFNLHASLLPQYRGAAPIQWALINGEHETGVTTFFLDKGMDTGKILLQEKVQIHPDETAGELHDRLMETGSLLVLQTVKLIETGHYQILDQSARNPDHQLLRKAPKIRKEDCRLDWNGDSLSLYNRIRGLSPVPGAYTIFEGANRQTFQLKIYRSRIQTGQMDQPPGQILTDHRTYFGITTTDGMIYLDEVQLPSKKRMSVSEFLRGFTLPDNLKIL